MTMQVGSIGFFAGAATHAGFFNRGEHHMYGNHYLQIFVCTFIAISLAIMGQGDSSKQAFLLTATLAGYYLSGLYGSLITYRIFLSPLRVFPGPFWAKISGLTLSAQLRKGDYPRRLLALHQQHGDFVRVGSSDLSIIHPKATNAIYGRESRCIKADWYDLTLPMVSIQTTRKRTEHDKRRRVWGGAFHGPMLRSYEDRIAIYQDQLIKRIEDFRGGEINITDIFNLYSFDAMGDLAFGTSFKMLQNNEQHWAVKLLHRGMMPLGFMFPTWLFRVLLAIPGATGDWFAFKDYCCQRLGERMNSKVQTPDIMSFLLEPWKDKKPTGSDLNILQGDSQLVVVAGSDTTASTLASIFYELVKNPDWITELKNAIGSHLKSGEILVSQSLQNLPELNAVINETLRLHPPTGLLQRRTPPEGLTIGDTFVPGNITVFCPQWVAGRSEKIYTNASEFCPQRWAEGSDMIKEPSAYAPFSTGPYGCIGRPLALLNLRTTLARLIHAFEDFKILLAEGEDGTAFEYNARTQFTTTPGPLRLVFKKGEDRKKTSKSI